MGSHSEHCCPLLSLAEHLLHTVAAFLDPDSIWRLHACSKSLQLSMGSCCIWQPICSARGWDPGPRYLPRERPYCTHYAAVRRSLCVECQRPTRYIFHLMGWHPLCADCEAQHSKYNLVTRREATEGIGLRPETVDTLPFVVSCGHPFYLRDTVLNLEAAQRAEARAAQKAAAGAACMSSEDDDDDGGDEQEKEQQQGQSMGGEEGEAALDWEGDGMDGYMSGLETEQKASKEEVAAGKAAAASARKAEEKAARKATKKQAKQEKREKRMGEGPSSGGRAEPLLSPGSVQEEGGRPIPGAKGGSRKQAARRNKENAQGTPGSLGSSHRGSLGRSGGSRGFGGRSFPGSSSRIATTSPPLEGQARGLHRKPPQASGWLQERQAIMEEFGLGSITGLVLVS